MHLFSKLLHIVDSGCKEFTRIGQNPVHHGGNHSPSYAWNFHSRLLTNSDSDLLTYEKWLVLLFLFLRDLLTYTDNYLYKYEININFIQLFVFCCFKVYFLVNPYSQIDKSRLINQLTEFVFSATFEFSITQPSK